LSALMGTPAFHGQPFNLPAQASPFAQQLSGHLAPVGGLAGLAGLIHSLLGGSRQLVPPGYHPGANGISGSLGPAPVPPDVSGFHQPPQLPGSVQAGTPTPPPGVAAPPTGSYNPAQFYRSTGQPQYAAQLWESHHPFAVAHGQVPGWVTQALVHALQSMQGGAAPTPPPTSQIQ